MCPCEIGEAFHRKRTALGEIDMSWYLCRAVFLD